VKSPAPSVPPGRFELTDEEILDLPVADLDEFRPVQESIPMHPGRSTAADGNQPEATPRTILADFGIHNRKQARAAGLRNPKRKRGMAVPK
jgi:hypothetical protein